MKLETLRLTLVISSLSSGGAERVMSIIANYWAKKDCSITIITIDSIERDFYELHPSINRTSLDLIRRSYNLLDVIKNNSIRIKRLRKEIKKSNPNVVISFLDKTNILTLLASQGLRVPIIVSERNNPLHEKVGILYNFLRRRLYPFATAVVVQSSDVYYWAREFLQENRIKVISNPVLPVKKNYSKKVFFNRGNNIVAMGRLVQQKGFDMLIRAFAKCVQNYPNWSLYIIGEGSERATLEALIKQLNISTKVHLLGKLYNPEQLLQHADMFVLSSRYEGFPNALLEAMSCGLPVISTDCPSGPNEIIRHGVDGILVPNEDIDALSEAMASLMSSEEERRRLGLRAIEVQQRFSLEKIMNDWESLINCVLRKKLLNNKYN